MFGVRPRHGFGLVARPQRGYNMTTRPKRLKTFFIFLIYFFIFLKNLILIDREVRVNIFSLYINFYDILSWKVKITLLEKQLLKLDNK
jgi:hypothetical protein